MSAGLVREVLSWVAPPVIGAVIGYVTNDIAIRMLFRPLRGVRVFGIRLPFTPGIFPKERGTLARSIGRMVSSELLTEDALRRQVHSQKAQAALARSISSVTAQVLDSPLSALSSGGASALASSLQDTLHDLLVRLLSSRPMIQAARDLAGKAVASVSRRKLGEALERAGLKSFVTERILPLLAREDARRAIGRAAAALLREQGPSMVRDHLLDSAARALEPFLPLVVQQLGAWLRSAAMRRELETRGAGLLSRALEKLNVLQRLLVSAGQFDRRLAEKMPEIVEEAIVGLETLAGDPETQRGLLAVLVQAVRGWGDGAGRAAGEQSGKGEGPGSLADAVEEVVGQLLSRLADEQVRKGLYAELEAALQGSAGQSVGGFAVGALGIDEGEIVDWVSTRALRFLARPETARALSAGLLALTAGFLEDNASTPVGDVFRVDTARKEKLDAFLLATLVGVVDAKLPDILRGLDVERLVIDKIDALDVRDVERLILQVIAAHLKWINVFGAILGFLIGLLQDLLRILRLW